MGQTKTPSIKVPTRKGHNLTVTWECNSDNHNGGQDLEYGVKNSKGNINWINLTQQTGDRSRTFYVNDDKFAKGTIYVRVRGKRASYRSGGKTITPTWSNWAQTSVTYSAPDVPKVSIETTASDGQCKGKWSITTSDTDKKPFAHIEWQTRIINGRNSGSPWTNVAWSSGHDGWGTSTSTSASSSTTINNSVSFTTTNSWTRVFRARAVGLSGTSEWSTVAYYTYANPKAATVSSAIGSARNNVYAGNMTWTAEKSFAYPIDNYQLQYHIGEPNLSGSDLVPKPGATWETIHDTYTSTLTKPTYPFSTSDKCDYDEALWVRVNTRHGVRTPTIGAARLVTYSSGSAIFGGVKPIQSPSDLDVDYDSETKTLVLTVSNPSSLSWTKTVVRVPTNYNSTGVTKTADYTVDGSLTFPNYIIPVGVQSVPFRVWVGSGSYWSNPVDRIFYPASEATAYAYAPTAITISPGSTAGVVNLSWKVNVGGATDAEVEYSTDNATWSSSNVYVTSTSTAYVTGLSYDVDYLFRVNSTTSRGETKWSDTATFKLKSSDLTQPTSLAVGQGSSKDSIRVTWNWNQFASATGISLSWADSSSAWDSSNAPSWNDYTKNQLASGVFNITGLERDKTWYVRARFIVGTAYSNPVTKWYYLPVTPVAPTNVTFARTSLLSTARVSWTWSWDDATEAEVSWSDNSNAWNSNEGLNTATVSKNGNNYLDIVNLETGKTWYAKVKFIFDRWTSESGTVSVDLSTSPSTPVVALSSSSISELLGKTDVSWTYSCEDGMPQGGAEVWLTDRVNLIRQIGSVPDATGAITIYAEAEELVGDNDYWITVRTVSAVGMSSEWSVPVKLHVSTKPTAVISDTSLVEVPIEESEDTQLALTELPLTFTVTGISSNGTITAYVERTGNDLIQRPDGRQAQTHAGEITMIASRYGDGDFSLDLEDMIGNLDEGCAYNLVAIVEDIHGNTDTATIPFVVQWTHQALMPDATIVVDQTEKIAMITPTVTGETEQGDVVDIYRLSADLPELIVYGGEFGTTYVDPYPTLGTVGGHRIVFRTKYGDIITAEGDMAVKDFTTDDEAAFPEDAIDARVAIINFGNSSVDIKYNIDLSYTWTKDFVETHYLGGSIQGDWNQAVSKKSTITTVAVSYLDQGMISSMRSLAAYAGVCHVRTPDGASFAADVQVSESWGYDNGHKIVSFSLNITRVDQEGYDGVALSMWNTGEDEND